MSEQNIQLLLHELISSFVEHPDALVVDVMADGPGYFIFEVTPHREDESKLLGQRGCHVRSLQFLTYRFGEAQGKKYLFNLVTTQESGGRRQADRKATLFDPEPIKRILLEIMKALELPVHVSAEQDGTTEEGYLYFVFVIKVMDPKSGKTLLGPVPFGKGQMTLTEALGTLLRAIARAEGVVFQVEVEQTP